MGLSSGVKLRKPVMISGRSSTSSGLKSSKYFFVTATRSSLKRSESDSLMRRSRKTRSTSCTHRRTALSGSEYADRIMRHMPCATLVSSRRSMVASTTFGPSLATSGSKALRCPSIMPA
eukprot:629365-Prorocentrum_minimum.AAC.1